MMTLPEMIEVVKKLNDHVSRAAQDPPVASDARDHLLQAHFRLTEALAHLRVAKQDPWWKS